MSDEPLPDLPSGVSLDQLLGIWGELVSAYWGQGCYTSHVAELYAYRLLRFDPKILHDAWAKQVRAEQALEARRSLVAIVRRFERAWDCRCMLDGVWVDEWERTAFYDHRCHVEVVPNGEG